MDAKTRTGLVHALMNKYVKLYDNRYGSKPPFNQYREKWGFGNMFDDLGDDAPKVLAYYFGLRRSHSTADLLNNYHEINEWRKEDEEDEKLRTDLLAETRQRVKEFEDRWHQKP